MCVGGSAYKEVNSQAADDPELPLFIAYAETLCRCYHR